MTTAVSALAFALSIVAAPSLPQPAHSHWIENTAPRHQVMVAFNPAGTYFDVNATNGFPGPVLFVQQATSTTYDGEFLRLHGVPATVWFSERPQRRAGHLAAAEYVAAWLPGGAFANDPPNAALAIQGNAADDPVIVVLNSAEIVEGGVFRYRVTVIEGTLPDAAEDVALFVDPPGQQDGTQSHLDDASAVAQAGDLRYFRQ